METLFEKTSGSDFSGTSKGKGIIDRRVFGKRVGLWGNLFGCEHSDLSRPFTRGKTGYRTCLTCGAKTRFCNETFKTSGDFYYPPVVKAESEI
jgi:hypothetical protein